MKDEKKPPSNLWRKKASERTDEEKAIFKAWSKSYYARNREKLRKKAREWATKHKEECRLRHKKWCEKNREHCTEYARRRRKANPEAHKKALRDWYWKDHEATLRRKQAYRDSHREQTREEGRRAEARRKLRKMTDADYYADWRARIRLNRCKKVLLKGRIYTPKINLRVPDTCTMSDILDGRSQFIAANMTKAQLAYALDLARERRERKR